MNLRRLMQLQDELVSTGTLGLIESQTLRNTALQVYNFPT